MWKILIPAVLLASYFGKQKLQQLFEGLTFEPEGINFFKNSLGLISTRFTFQLKIFNKSNVPVPIQSVSGTAYSGADLLANFNVQQALTIPANGNVTMPVDITAGNLAALKFIIQGIVQKAIPKIQIKGGVFTVLGTAPLNVTYDKIQLLPAK